MGVIWRFLASYGLKALLVALTKLTESQLKDVADRINQKIDVPIVSEETEGKVILSVLTNAVLVTKELLSAL